MDDIDSNGDAVAFATRDGPLALVIDGDGGMKANLTPISQIKFLELETEFALHAHAHTLCLLTTRTSAQHHHPYPRLHAKVQSVSLKKQNLGCWGRMIVFVRFF